MNRIVALYWDNIDPRVVKAQAAVFAHFGYAIDQRERTNVNHGDFLDAYMAELDEDDIALLTDIDCFPLNRDIVERAFAAARAGAIFGCAQSTNHIDPDRIYVAPMFMSVSRRTWDALGRPSFRPDPENDVAQRLHDLAVKRGVAVERLDPLGAIVPKWRLGDVGFYGLGTFYRGGVFHLFESRWTPFAFLLFDVAEAVVADRAIDHVALMAKALAARGNAKWARRLARWRKAIWLRRLGKAGFSVIPVYVLNLARSPERRAFMTAICARAGVTPEFVAAVDGRRRQRGGGGVSKAETALILSHRKAWRRLLASPAAFAVVLEDDAHLGEGFRELLSADWSGASFDLVKLETLFDRVWLARRGVRVGSRELRRLGAEHLASAGYLISSAGARKMLERTRALDEPVDHTLFGREAIFEGRIVAYQLYPAIVVQDNVHPDPAARADVGTTLHEGDRARLAEAARGAKPRGWTRIAREAGRLFNQARRAARFFPGWRRQRVPWR